MIFKVESSCSSYLLPIMLDSLQSLLLCYAFTLQTPGVYHYAVLSSGVVLLSLITQRVKENSVYI